MTLSLKALHEKREQLKADLARSPARLSYRTLAQVWQAELSLCAERFSRARSFLLADSCQCWKDHDPDHPPRTGGRSHPSADRRIPSFSPARAGADCRERTALPCTTAAAGSHRSRREKKKLLRRSTGHRRRTGN